MRRCRRLQHDNVRHLAGPARPASWPDTITSLSSLIVPLTSYSPAFILNAGPFYRLYSTRLICAGLRIEQEEGSSCSVLMRHIRVPGCMLRQA